MTEEKVCKAVRDMLFKNGSCKTGVWFHIELKDDNTGKVAKFDAIVPNVGNIKIRRPIKRIEGCRVLFELLRCTKKNTLHSMGYYEFDVDKNMPKIRSEI